jgi:hypothetical protein
MNTASSGVRLALTCGLELHQRWREYWRAIHPWAWIYIGLNVCDLLLYPQGNPNKFMGVLWMLLYLGLTLLMCWNWQNVLTGRGQNVTWDHGWHGQGFRVYVVTLAALLLALPLVVAFVVGLPLALLTSLLAGLTESAFVIMVTGCLLSIFYLLSRLIALPSLLLNNTVAPVPAAWQLSGQQPSYTSGALLAFLLVSGVSNLLIISILQMLKKAEIASPSLWVMPLSLSVGLFMTGWLILLAQRLFEALSNGDRYGSAPRA